MSPYSLRQTPAWLHRTSCGNRIWRTTSLRALSGRRNSDDSRTAMTERLYYRDAYLCEFEGRVVERADEGKRIYLDRSAFYPTSGGQPNDLGSLGGVDVIDVVDEEDRVAHVLASALSTDEVRGEVDWRRRFDHMQQHTGQHLLSAIFADSLGWPTLSVHFGPDYATLDLDTESIAVERLREVELRANAIVAEDRPVTVSFEEAATAQGLRKASERGGELRIVTIDGVDRSACGGTHVQRTGAIGAILLRRQEKIRRATRVEFICGQRAIRRARADFEALSAMAQAQSCSIDELQAIVGAQGDQLRSAESERKRMDGELATFRARDAFDRATPDARGRRWLVDRRRTGRVDDMRSLALAFAAIPRGVFVGIVDDPATILVAASDESEVDAGASLKAALSAAGGRGGGSPRLAQGSVPTRDALESVLISLGVPGGRLNDGTTS